MSISAQELASIEYARANSITYTDCGQQVTMWIADAPGSGSCVLVDKGQTGIGRIFFSHRENDACLLALVRIMQAYSHPGYRLVVNGWERTSHTTDAWINWKLAS